MAPALPYSRIGALESLAEKISGSGYLSAYRSDYEKCRLEDDFTSHLYATLSLSAATLIASAALLLSLAYFLRTNPAMLLVLATIMAMLPLAVFYMRIFSVRSMKNFRGALIDSSIAHATGFMMALASSSVPLKRMFQGLSNLGKVYGDDLALESTYLLSLVDEDGMDIVSAANHAQSTSPSAYWQELLIGIAGVYSSGGSLQEYLKGKYGSLIEKKRSDIKKYNESVQGLASIYLSIVGVAALFVALINLVFNMSGMLSGDSLIWADAIVIVPMGSFCLTRVLKAINPEA